MNPMAIEAMRTPGRAIMGRIEGPHPISTAFSLSLAPQTMQHFGRAAWLASGSFFPGGPSMVELAPDVARLLRDRVLAGLGMPDFEHIGRQRSIVFIHRALSDDEVQYLAHMIGRSRVLARSVG